METNQSGSNQDESRLRTWISRFREAYSEEYDGVVNIFHFIRKMERVLEGEESLVIIPCFICGGLDPDRYLLKHKARIVNNGVINDIEAKYPIAVCAKHDVQTSISCLCGEHVWYAAGQSQRVPWIWFDKQGNELTKCSCGIRLGTSEQDNKQIRDEVLTRAGYSVRVKSAKSVDKTSL